MIPIEDRTHDVEPEDDHALIVQLTSFWPTLEEPATRRQAAMIADPIMGSLLASLPRNDSAIV
jgi:hypothetical protein